jgi:hypothetical protein
MSGPSLVDRVVSAAPRSEGRRFALVAVSGLLITAAVIGSWGAVRGLRWPHDLDLLRNIASGVAFRDGHLLRDPHYAGVPAWYSPLTSAVLAFSSLVTSVSMNTLGTQGGALINLISPIALTWLTTRWFGREAAIGALAAFLFAMGVGFPAFAVVSYTPHLFVPFYALGIFFVALTCLPAAVNRGSNRDGVLLGLATGVLALAHPGAIMILVAIVAVQFARAGFHGSGVTRRHLLRTAGIAAATALVVSAPFWLPVVVRYHGRVANDAPSISVWLGLHRSNFWNFMGDFFWRWQTLVIAAGLPLWFRARRRSGRPGGMRGACDGLSMLAPWTVLALVLLPIASYRPEWFPLPSYHFLFYLSAALCVWFGIAVAAIVHALLGRRYERGAALATLLAVAGISLFTFPSWRADVVASRDAAKTFQARFDALASVAWIRRNTQRDDVFITSGGGSFLGGALYTQFFPGLAGRHSVSVNSPEFSSPWVDWVERQVDAQAMLRALGSCQLERFGELAEEYGKVRYVLVPLRSGVANVVPSACRDQVPVVYRDDGVFIQRIDAGGTS